MTTTPVLALPDFSQSFDLETDACSHGVGAVMQQGRAIAYFSKALGPRFLSISIYEKELLAIVMAITKWRSYLLGNDFSIHTDHQSIKYFLEQRIHTLLQQRWLAKLLGYDYDLRYRKGKDNKAADALSRVVLELASCSALSCVQPTWMQEVVDSYTQDSVAQQAIQQLIIAPDSVPLHSYQQGILRYKGKVYIGNSEAIKQKILQAVQSSALGGHGNASYISKSQDLFFLA